MDVHKHHKTLHVVSVISNPVRFESRYKLYQKFKEHMKEFDNVSLSTVEIAFGDRQHFVTGHPLADCSTERYLQLRSYDEVWHKENMGNLMVQHLPRDWEYVAFIDADVSFVNRNWAHETLHQLQHYMVVQLFQDALDLGPTKQVIQSHKGFCYQYRKGAPRGAKYEFWHPGFAWAYRREAWNSLGGMLDTAILGAGDHHMALSLIGDAKSSLPGGISEDYAREVYQWQERAERYIKRDIGFVPGTLLHHWHGKKKDRKYIERWEILIRNAFSPRTDLKRDWQGLWSLEVSNPRQIALRDDFRRYYRQRNEDSIDLE